MRRVVIESPFGRNPDGSKCTPEEYERNRIYVLRCLKHSLDQREAPFASHALYPLVLDDTDKGDRDLGIRAGFAWGQSASRCVVYEDYGITEGMIKGISKWDHYNVERRSIGKNP